MTYRHLYHFGLVLFAAVFFAVQTVSVSHATSFGEAPHEHEEQVCVLSAVASDDEIAVAPTTPPAITPAFISVRAEYQSPVTQAPARTMRARAPPPRAPPATL